MANSYLLEIVLIALVILTSSTFVKCKVFGKCELAHELLRLGFPRDELHQWVCLAKHESNFDTTFVSSVGGSIYHKTTDYGLFQVSQKRNHFRYYDSLATFCI